MIRCLKFNKEEQEIYGQFFNESKAEFKELSHKNEVMKNFVGILQKILRLRQICDHIQLVKQPKELLGTDVPIKSYEEISPAVEKEGVDVSRASPIFAFLKGGGTTQCVECGCDLGGFRDGAPERTLWRQISLVCLRTPNEERSPGPLSLVKAHDSRAPPPHESSLPDINTCSA